ncbi:protein translocase subunit secA [Nitrosospira multiformis ATCC 25196]|uniref:Protein translocase subunit SecA 2 n=2 Tax=Nitrosospira multiformis (strain ATCC 25196 / NCIMB 11849 / C 71) TaxID=323848 RepID=SECA2_NITMU|nr:preprotein translocase subunit SecA [Nitrosospira multiformis]Q2YAJ4.1 RecName: Full=Protein translocase subunit SecA 2 [Nitrosospira multiformis ATCC 25196]ABB74227.1 protein translocase subunit secA [Nitrosospira multiformis ATCC 25196]SEF48092.1 protein translocase subunit secA [Nitrosospira multiformis ATCC 25196]
MSKALLAAWRINSLAPAPYPERLDTNDNALDRFLGSSLGQARLWASHLRLKRLRSFADKVVHRSNALSALSEAELAACVDDLRVKLARQGLTEDLTIEVFSLVREVCGRKLGLRHFPVQLIGGRVILAGKLAEMQTGEGKSLTAVLPAIAVALSGLPVHVITVNEYLVRRDARFMRPVYEFFGLDVGMVVPDQDPETRRNAYGCDVTYCVNKDLVFDYLRDRIDSNRDVSDARRAVARLFRGDENSRAYLRGLFFGIVDEADSVLIDEARTPLIISSSVSDKQGVDDYRRALDFCRQLRDGLHFRIFAADKLIQLTPAGRDHITNICGNLPGVWQVARARFELIEQALAAQLLYMRDKHYIVKDEKVQIVDEYTGRVMSDRTWESGLHQMIEVKEGCALTDRRKTISRITYQRFFRRYLRLGGMTGTAAEVVGELSAIFGLDVLRIPTNRAVQRKNLGTRIFLDTASRWDAVLKSIRRVRDEGRPVLIGTRSVAASEHLSSLLKTEGIEHSVINARQDEDEATVVEQAGRVGRVTVATNMAGRGTDIKLESGVSDRGGLHVILSEFHESPRIDRQLYGRAGRQGDKGSYESIVSLEDELFVLFSGEMARRVMSNSSFSNVITGMKAKLLRGSAQRSSERYYSRIRRQTVLEDQRLAKMLAFAGRGE